MNKNNNIMTDIFYQVQIVGDEYDQIETEITHMDLLNPSSKYYYDPVNKCSNNFEKTKTSQILIDFNDCSYGSHLSKSDDDDIDD